MIMKRSVLFFVLVLPSRAATPDFDVGYRAWSDGDYAAAMIVVGFAIVVTSDSPKWASHIKDNWLARFGEHVSVLNYSHKREWPRNIESKSVYRFTRYRCDHPTVIIPRKTGRPAVYSFHAVRA
jgi:hypothetical protein